MALPLIVGALGVFAAASITGIIARALLALGMGVVTYVGVDLAMTQAVNLLQDKVGGIPADMLQLLGLGGFDVMVSLIISAKTSVIAFQLANAGFKKLSFIIGG